MILLLLGPTTRADTIWIASATGNELEIASVRILDVADGVMIFETSIGRRAQRELQQISRIQIDDEPALAPAEIAFHEREWKDAAAGYLRVLQSTRRTWLKAWIAPRLLESAENAVMFDAAVHGYVALVFSNPRRAELYVPMVPDDGPRDVLDGAVAHVNEALEVDDLSAQQKQCLLSFLLDLHRARGDVEAAEATLALMLDSGDAAAARAAVRMKLDDIARALGRSRFQQAIDDVNANRQLFIEPRDQAEALYYLAEAQYGIAAASNDVKALQDSAIAYMRVVTHFKDIPGAPYVAPALLKTAAIHERLNDFPAARASYRQVAAQFPNTPAATAARASLNRIGAN